MAKLLSAPISKADIQEYIATQDDLALEMQCVSVCRANGWLVRHGGTYTDGITKKMRQFDIRAQRTRSDLRVYLAIECKALSVSFPLVVSRLPRDTSEAFHEVICSSDLFTTHVVGLGDEAIAIRVDPFHCAYARGESVGKHTVQVGRTVQNEIITGDAESFDKWSQAIASAADLVRDARSAHEEIESGYIFSAVIPMLVVPNGTLWAVDYKDSGKLWDGPLRIDAAEIFLGREHFSGTFAYTISHLHVVTSTGLEMLLARFADAGDAWADWFPSAPLEKAVYRRRGIDK